MRERIKDVNRLIAEVRAVITLKYNKANKRTCRREKEKEEEEEEKKCFDEHPDDDDDGKRK